MIDTALRQVDGRGFDPAEVEAGEQILVDAAASVGPHDLRRFGQGHAILGQAPRGIFSRKEMPDVPLRVFQSVA